MRRTLMLIVASSPLACPQDSPEPTTELPPAPAVPQTNEKFNRAAGPFSLAVDAATAPTSYRRTEVLKRTLAGKPIDIHKIEIEMNMKAAPREGGQTVEVEVTQIWIRARRDDYKFDLDSSRPGDLKRIAGGSVAGISMGLALPFAFLGKPVKIELDARGHLSGVRGATPVRSQLLSYFPPKPRDQKSTADAVAQALSDAAIANLLLPPAVLLPADGALELGRRINTEGRTTADDLDIQFGQAVLLESSEDLVVRIRHRRREGAPEDAQGDKRLIDGSIQTTVDFDRASPLFKLASRSIKRQIAWEGTLEGEPGTYPIEEDWSVVFERDPAPRVAPEPTSTAFHQNIPKKPKGSASKPAPKKPASQPAP